MRKHVLKNFLRDAQEYALAVDYWRELSTRILEAKGMRDLWEPWLNVKYADGTPFQDGNPIYSLASRANHKGLRIIQVEPNQSGLEFSAWMDTFGGCVPDDDESIEELVISCALSDEASRIATSLISVWLTEAITAEEMEGVIREVVP